ncbi:MAG TPA: hypothetical protein VHK28_08330, partial [Candidatus Limnocylindria bacterium]|nr:hypothetical protein [Candidatus Limnocylindria bacterium]
MRRRIIATLAATALSAAFASTALAGGPPAVGFYVDDALYRTIGTPTAFSRTGAPAHSFDTIYALGGELLNVAEAKPGDRDFNGGRWMVLPVEWHVTPYQLTSAEAVVAAEDRGELTIGSTPVRMFECPVIKLQ